MQEARKKEVTNLLMTATADQLDLLKQSLSNFKPSVSHQQSHLTNDADEPIDEYIEEVFEEALEEDEESQRQAEQNDSILEMTEEERLAELNKLEMQENAAKSHRMMHPVSANATGSGKIKTSRPISASYKLTP